MAIKSLGRKHVLLTEKETLCFKVACRYKRRALLKGLFDPRSVSPGLLARLHWSHNFIIASIQALIVVLLLPLIVLSIVLKAIYQLLVFPFRYFSTFIVPSDLAAPGEKSLVGIHNAFSKYNTLGIDDYIDCLNEWIVILFGKGALERRNLAGYLESEVSRLRLERKHQGDSEFSPTVRSLLANRREKLSRALGHYENPSKSQTRTKLSA